MTGSNGSPSLSLYCRWGLRDRPSSSPPSWLRHLQGQVQSRDTERYKLFQILLVSARYWRMQCISLHIIEGTLFDYTSNIRFSSGITINKDCKNIKKNIWSNQIIWNIYMSNVHLYSLCRASPVPLLGFIGKFLLLLRPPSFVRYAQTTSLES